MNLFDGIDRSTGPSWWGVTPDHSGIVAAINEAAERMAAKPAPPPCGTKERPHLVSPEVYAGAEGRCVECGQPFEEKR